MPAYALGKILPGGTWYFFPLAIGVKAPLGFLALALVGAVLSVSRSWRERRWRLAVPAAVALALLAASMRSTIAIGGRHVLPLYPLLAILAGVGAAGLWRAGGLPRVGVLVLGAWLLAASVRAHPDYLADFNEIARERPEHFLLTSDLDYGQDVGRLADALKARGIDSVTVYLFSFPDNRALGSPRYVAWPEWHHATPPPATGWIAASSWVLYGVPGIPWLQQHRPVARIGRTIYLFYVPPAGGGKAG